MMPGNLCCESPTLAQGPAMLLGGRKGGWRPAVMRSVLFGLSEGHRAVKKELDPGPASGQREEAKKDGGG